MQKEQSRSEDTVRKEHELRESARYSVNEPITSYTQVGAGKITSYLCYADTNSVAQSTYVCIHYNSDHGMSPSIVHCKIVFIK